MENWNVLRFYLDSYETSGSASGPTRIPYDELHPQGKKRIRVVRNARHNCIPNLTGIPLPRSDEEGTRELYCASILALFKPWRNIQDLLPQGSTWENELEMFTRTADRSYLRIIEHIQYNYHSKVAADEDRDASPEDSFRPNHVD